MIRVGGLARSQRSRGEPTPEEAEKRRSKSWHSRCEPKPRTQVAERQLTPSSLKSWANRAKKSAADARSVEVGVLFCLTRALMGDPVLPPDPLK